MDASLYRRPNKPKTMGVTKRPGHEKPDFDKTSAPVEVHASTECHVTPPEVAERMVSYLDATQDMMTLEPSCGTGNLIQALLDDGHSALEICGIEQNGALKSATRHRFNGEVSIIRDCFLEYAERWQGAKYARIIMNPPFRQVKKHMNAAIEMLGSSGYDNAVLVALVPVTYQHELAEEMEALPNDTFANAKVNTKIVRIEL